MNVLQRLIDWLTRPGLSIRLLQTENGHLRTERDYYRDLFTQALEQSRIVPRQPEHIRSVPDPVSERTTWADEIFAAQEEDRKGYEEYMKIQEMADKGPVTAPAALSEDYGRVIHTD